MVEMNSHTHRRYQRDRVSEVVFENWVALVNLSAGQLRNPAALGQLLEWLDEAGIGVIETCSVDAASAFIRDRTELSGVIVCGGDGTVFSALNSMDLRRQRLAIVPCGRGNSVARDLGIETPGQAFAAFHQRRFRELDVIRVSLHGDEFGVKECLALNGVAFGALPRAILRANTLCHLGQVGYAIGGLTNWISPTEYEIQLDSHQKRLEKLCGVTVLNTRHLGKYVPIDAGDPTDRKLEVVFHSPNPFRAKFSELALVAGFGMSNALAAQSEAVTIRCREHNPVYVDGDVVPNVSSATLHCQPAAVQCLVRETE